MFIPLLPLILLGALCGAVLTFFFERELELLGTWLASLLIFGPLLLLAALLAALHKAIFEPMRWVSFGGRLPLLGPVALFIGLGYFFIQQDERLKRQDPARYQMVQDAKLHSWKYPLTTTHERPAAGRGSE
jgi:hypothetical protein